MQKLGLQDMASVFDGWNLGVWTLPRAEFAHHLGRLPNCLGPEGGLGPEGAVTNGTPQRLRNLIGWQTRVCPGPSAPWLCASCTLVATKTPAKNYLKEVEHKHTDKKMIIITQFFLSLYNAVSQPTRMSTQRFTSWANKTHRSRQDWTT